MNSTHRVLTLVLLAACATSVGAVRALAQDVAVPPPASPPMAAPAAPAALADAAAAPEQPSAPRADLYVAHAPVSETTDGQLTLVFSVTPIDRVEAVIVRWRARTPDAELHESVVGRRADGWLAEIRDADVVAPGIVYWVLRREPGQGEPQSREHAVFASEANPHPVAVHEEEVRAYERRSLARRNGRRYRAGASFEYVSLGAHDLPPGESGPRAASYWRSAASFSYAFFGFVDQIRFELGVQRGDQEIVDFGGAIRQSKIGFNWGSGELTFRLHELIRIRSRLIFGVSAAGFELGGAGALIIGDPEGTSFEVGGEGVTRLGGSGRIRLGWATVPRMPMGATIELTTYPTDDSVGVRLLFDAAYEIYAGAFVRLTGGYRGWTSIVGGPSLAADVVLAF